MKKNRGVTLILVSALLFALSTVAAKYATRDGNAHALHVTMARFTIGLALSTLWIVRNPSDVRPRSTFWVLVRAVTNLAATLLFFIGVQLSMVSTTNLLNMTFPVFVFAFSPFITRERIPWYQLILLATTLVGVWLVILPSGIPESAHTSSATVGNLLALASAAFVGISTIALRMVKRTDRSATVVFYVMLIGFMVNLFLVLGIRPPVWPSLGIAILAGSLSAVGQFALTSGFSHVSAATGSLLSTARIGFAFLFGITLFSDSVSTIGIVGTGIVLASLLTVSVFVTQER